MYHLYEYDVRFLHDPNLMEVVVLVWMRLGHALKLERRLSMIDKTIDKVKELACSFASIVAHVLLHT